MLKHQFSRFKGVSPDSVAPLDISVFFFCLFVCLFVFAFVSFFFFFWAFLFQAITTANILFSSQDQYQRPRILNHFL